MRSTSQKPGCFGNDLVSSKPVAIQGSSWIFYASEVAEWIFRSKTPVFPFVRSINLDSWRQDSDRANKCALHDRGVKVKERLRAAKSRSLAVAIGLLAVVFSNIVLVSPSSAMVILYNGSGGTGGSTAAALDPAEGQYFPIAPTTVLDTRTGLGEAGGAASIPSNGSVLDIPVLGVSGIPTSGIQSVFVNLAVISTTGAGSLSLYQSDVSDPDEGSVLFESNHGSSGSAIVGLSASSSAYPGSISITNHSTGTVVVAITVEGYFSDATATVAGDTYSSLSTPADVVDTRSGLGGRSTPLGSNQSIQFSVLGFGSLNVSDVDAAEIEVGALDASSDGYLMITGQFGDPTVRSLSYTGGEKNRLTDITKVGLSGVNGPANPNGQITITNRSNTTVDIQVILEGYFILPTSFDAIATSYTSLAPTTVCSTITGASCDVVTYQSGQPVANEVTSYGAVAANSSITIEEAGQVGIPSSGVDEVAQEVTALNPSATGWLTMDPAGTPTNQLSTLAIVNFVGGDNGGTTFDSSLVSRLSAAGAVMITNHSSGTVWIQLSADGYWSDPTVPSMPINLDSTLNGTSSDLSWSPPSSDGGSPIQSYDVNEITSGGPVSLGTTYGVTQEVAVTPISAGDLIQVVAVNLEGASQQSAEVAVNDLGVVSTEAFDGITAQPQLPAGDSLPVIWSGQITDSNGNPVSADIEADAVQTNPSTTSPVDIPLAEAQTDSMGNFTLAAGPTSAINAAMDSGGNFDVDLDVTTSVGSYFFSRQMNLQTGSGNDSFTLWPDNGVLTSDGLATLGSVNWISNDGDSYQNGDALTVDAANAPSTTDVATDNPLIGPSPYATVSALESDPNLAANLNSASPDPTLELEPEISSEVTSNGFSSVTLGNTKKNQAPVNKYLTCFMTGAGEWNNNQYSSLPAFTGQQIDYGDPSAPSMPFEAPVVLSQVNFQQGGTWSAKQYAGNSQQTDIQTVDQHSTSVLGVYSYTDSKQTGRSSSIAYGVGYSTPVTSSSTQSFGSALVIWEHPFAPQKQCWQTADAKWILGQSLGYLISTGQCTHANTCTDINSGEYNLSESLKLLLAMNNSTINGFFSQKNFRFTYALQWLPKTWNRLQEFNMPSLFPSSIVTDSTTCGGWQVGGQVNFQISTDSTNRFANASGESLGLSVQVGYNAGDAGVSLGDVGYSASTLHSYYYGSSADVTLDITNTAATGNIESVCPTIGPDATVSLADGWPTGGVKEDDGGWVLFSSAHSKGN
jgi:hypothetical protein